MHRLDGKRFRRTEMEKEPEYFLLYYSASWCPPCRASAPQMVENFKDAVENNPKVEFIHISRDRDDGAATSWAADVGFPWLTILPKDVERSGLLDYRTATSVPHAILVDSEGSVLATGGSATIAKARELGAGQGSSSSE